MRKRRVSPIGTKLRDCDLCGWTYELQELRKQGKGLVCPSCYDEPHTQKEKRSRGRI
jgi:hypothetical protein